MLGANAADIGLHIDDGLTELEQGRLREQW